MTKDEILEKSRKENKEQDLYEMSVNHAAARAGAVGMIAMAMLLTVIHIMQTGEFDLRLWLVILAESIVSSVYKAVKMRNLREIGWAVFTVIVEIAIFVMAFV